MPKKIKTLIVEDNATFRQTIKELLIAKFPSMFITQAADGKEAFIKLANYRTDLIFMDIGLPVESGLVLTQKIKKIYPEAVIIILTNHDLQEYRIAAYQKGAQYFLSKESTKKDEIVAVVESILADVERI